MLLTLGIFALSLALIMLRPKPLNEGTAAASGAFLMVVAGLVTPPMLLAGAVAVYIASLL